MKIPVPDLTFCLCSKVPQLLASNCFLFNEILIKNSENERTSIEHPLSNDCLRMYVKPSIISSVDEEQDKDKRNVKIIIKPCISSTIA
uniref:Uncharacterized protein n=1 Tax=Glossina palpalis gambiensis TaxID=67801 RepID=A0A1B0AXC8_9MUSC